MTATHPCLPRGFTLVEAVFVLAVAAVLLGLAAADLRRAFVARALSAQSSEFMAGLRFARSEAIKRGQPVTVCAAEPEARACRRGHAVDWRAGWLVFVDHGERGVMREGDIVLRVQQPLSPSGGVAGTRASITYTAAGIATDAASHFRFQPVVRADGPVPAARLVCVSKQGRPRLAPGAACS